MATAFSREQLTVLESIREGLQSAQKGIEKLVSNRPGPTGKRNVAEQPVATKKPCRNYLKYPAPQKIRPRATSAFRVANLCQDYNFPTGLDGGGKIGILELGGGYTPADLDLFSQANGLGTIVVNPISLGADNTPDGDADGEVLLDIQVAAAAYFYCTGQMPTINMYFAPNDFDSFAAVIEQAAEDGCDTLSISWGSDESGWDPSKAKKLEAAAAAATERGCVIFASSGDNSSSDGSPGANVDMPSSCPHIIGCGGTKKTAFSEAVWGDGTPSGQGTGGGFSVIFPPPGFQASAKPLPVPEAPKGAKPGRMVPDVAAAADPDTGYLVFIHGQEVQIGGTSAVAPLYAGLFAALGRQLGFVTPTLYQHEDAFVDITQGSNGSFNAAVGPDPCTGLGVPDGEALLKALSEAEAPAARRLQRV